MTAKSQRKPTAPAVGFLTPGRAQQAQLRNSLCDPIVNRRFAVILTILTVTAAVFGQTAEKTPKQEAATILERSSRKLASIARLQVPEDLLWDIHGPAQYQSPRDLEDPTKLLFDESTTGEGIYPTGPEPLTVTLNFVARRAIKSMQVLYDGDWPTQGIPTIPIYAVSTRGDTVRVGLLPQMPQEPGKRPVVQQAQWLEETGRAGHEWTRLRIIFPPELSGLGITEIRIHAHDGALRRIAVAANDLSKNPELICTGILSQLAIALRVRRAKKPKKTQIEEVVAEYSDLIAHLSGVSMDLEMTHTGRGDEPGQMEVKLQNTSDQSLIAPAIRLQLPPGWRAAPARLQLEEVEAGQTVLRTVTLWSNGKPGQAPEAYLVGAWNEEPFFLISRCVRADGAVEEQS